MMNMTLMLSIVGAVTVVTNVIVQVLKQVTAESVPTNVVALVVAIALSMIAGGAYAQMQSIAVTWYMVCGAVVVGFFAAYAAMFGYDKLCETLKEIACD